jgi:ABC-type nickel/cobalt efflux system permease component RcnA
MKLGERLALAVAVLIGLFGFVMIAGVLIGTLEGTSKYSARTDLVLAFLLGILPLAVGAFLFWRVRRAVARRRCEETEGAVLKVARERQGVISAVDVAADCGMSLEQAEEILDRLQRRGFSEMDVLDSGVVVYRFRF